MELPSLLTLTQSMPISEHFPHLLIHFKVVKNMFIVLFVRKAVFSQAIFFLKTLKWGASLNLKSRLDLNFTPMSNCRSIFFSGIAKKSWKVRASRDL